MAIARKLDETETKRLHELVDRFKVDIERDVLGTDARVNLYYFKTREDNRSDIVASAIHLALEFSGITSYPDRVGVNDGRLVGVEEKWTYGSYCYIFGPKLTPEAAAPIFTRFDTLQALGGEKNPLKIYRFADIDQEKWFDREGLMAEALKAF